MASSAILYFNRKRRLQRRNRQLTIYGTAPVLHPMKEGDLLNVMTDWGTYNQPVISKKMKKNDNFWKDFDHTTVVHEGEIWSLREVVEFNGVFVEFQSAMIEVTA